MALDLQIGLRTRLIRCCINLLPKFLIPQQIEIWSWYNFKGRVISYILLQYQCRRSMNWLLLDRLVGITKVRTVMADGKNVIDIRRIGLEMGRSILEFDAGILARVDRRMRVLWHRTTRETSKRLWPLTATAGISTGHIRIIAESDVLQGQCFHSYDDEIYAEERE